MLVTSGAPGPPDTWRVVPTGAAHRAAGRGTTLVTVRAPDGHSAEAERPRACLWRPHVPTQTVPDAQRGLRRPHPGMIGPTLGRVCALCLPARRCTTLLPSRGRLGRGPRGLVPAGRFLRGCCGTTSPPSHGTVATGGRGGPTCPPCRLSDPLPWTPSPCASNPCGAEAAPQAGRIKAGSRQSEFNPLSRSSLVLENITVVTAQLCGKYRFIIQCTFR